jgi:catechol-2,3-dioxygenase
MSISRVRPRKMSHVVYRTNRFDQMISWYETVFDAKVKSRSAALAFMSFDDEDHRFAFANLQTLKPQHSEPD